MNLNNAELACVIQITHQAPKATKRVNPTYAEMRQLATTLWTEEGTPQYIISNLKTALNAWMRYINVADNSLIGPEFREDFEEALYQFSTHEIEHGRGKRTAKDRSEFIVRWKKIYDENSMLDLLPSSFSEALGELLRRANFDAYELSRRSGIHIDTIKNWLADKYVPRVDAVPRLSKIETALAVPHGTLIRKVGHIRHQWLAAKSKQDPTLRTQTPYQKRMSQKHKEKHYYSHPPTPRLQEQWTELIRFKSDPFREGAIPRNTWRLKRADKVARKYDWSAKFENMICPTANMQWNMLSLFLGWLSQPSHVGKGIQREASDTLAWLIRDDVFVQYLNWQIRRSDNIIHNGIMTALQNAASMLRPKTGFIYNNPWLGHTLADEHLPKNLKNLPADEFEQAWQSECERVRRVYIARIKANTNSRQFKKSRDPRAPILSILQQERPSEALMLLVREMESNPPPKNNRQVYPAYLRDKVLLKIMITNPLRVGMFPIIKYYPNNTGNIYQTNSGAWRLRFEAEDFKNTKGAAKEDYDVAIPQFIWADIEHYLAEGRPYLKHADKPYFFQGSSTNRESTHDRFGIQLHDRDGMWTAESVSVRIAECVILYMPGQTPFRGHAIRHIIATDYLKRNPGDYITVAKLLHDELSTVLREYAHLQVDDSLKRLHGYVEGFFNNH